MLYTPVAPFFDRRVLYARIDHPLGPLDAHSTHSRRAPTMAATNAVCNSSSCGTCPRRRAPPNAITTSRRARVSPFRARLVESTYDVPQPAIVTGDFDSPPKPRPDETVPDTVLVELTGRGWIDSYLAASNPECNPASGTDTGWIRAATTLR